MNFKNEHGQSILARIALGWTSLEERRALMKAKLMYKTVNQLAPQRLCNIFQFSNTVNSYNLRDSSTGLFIPRPRTEFFLKSFSYSGAKLWIIESEAVGQTEQAKAESFLKNVNTILAQKGYEDSVASWAFSTNITDYNSAVKVQASLSYSKAYAEIQKNASRFDLSKLKEDAARQIKFLRNSTEKPN